LLAAVKSSSTRSSSTGPGSVWDPVAGSEFAEAADSRTQQSQDRFLTVREDWATGRGDMQPRILASLMSGHP
jgi:hypothetical protein